MTANADDPDIPGDLENTDNVNRTDTAETTEISVNLSEM